MNKKTPNTKRNVLITGTLIISILFIIYYKELSGNIYSDNYLLDIVIGLAGFWLGLVGPFIFVGLVLIGIVSSIQEKFNKNSLSDRNTNNKLWSHLTKVKIKLDFESLKVFILSIPNKLKALYFVWLLLHIYLFLRSFSYSQRYREEFYPFDGGLRYYDITEFVVYVLFPFATLLVIYYWKKPNH